MVTRGWINHYDDPDDEYWELPPEDGGARSVSMKNVGAAVEYSPLIESSAHQSDSSIVIVIGDDRLPVSIFLPKRWVEYTDPSTYGKSILDSYARALLEVDLEAERHNGRIQAGVQLRDIIPRLLQTRTYAEYLSVYNDLLRGSPATVNGRGRTSSGYPSLTVTATSSRLLDVWIDVEWARKQRSDTISLDIVDCCNAIRKLKPEVVHDEYLSQETDDEVVARMVRHAQYLMRYEI